MLLVSRPRHIAQSVFVVRLRDMFKHSHHEPAEGVVLLVDLVGKTILLEDGGFVHLFN
jgi:hypothetical protein